jgi:hypothetical protein
MEGREGRAWRGEGEMRRARSEPKPCIGCCPPATGAIASCAKPDLLLIHLNETIVTYVYKQMKHLQFMSETLAKTPKNT